MPKILTLFNNRNIGQNVDLGKGNTEQGGNQKRMKRTAELRTLWRLNYVE